MQGGRSVRCLRPSGRCDGARNYRRLHRSWSTVLLRRLNSVLISMNTVYTSRGQRTNAGSCENVQSRWKAMERGTLSSPPDRSWPWKEGGRQKYCYTFVWNLRTAGSQSGVPRTLRFELKPMGNQAELPRLCASRASYGIQLSRCTGA